MITFLDLPHHFYLMFKNIFRSYKKELRDDWYFDLAYHYAFSLSIFIIALIFSSAAPLMTFFGFLFFFIKVSPSSVLMLLLVYDRQIQPVERVHKRIWIERHPRSISVELPLLWHLPLLALNVPSFHVYHQYWSDHRLRYSHLWRDFLHGCLRKLQSSLIEKHPTREQALKSPLLSRLSTQSVSTRNTSICLLAPVWKVQQKEEGTTCGK